MKIKSLGVHILYGREPNYNLGGYCADCSFGTTGADGTITDIYTLVDETTRIVAA